ncbi:acidic tetraheme cytochrome c3 TmcA [Desulfocurvus sp.]|jgi:hypothetical protein|uniref:acidic tetraheme cytochrome c3 TmcA n=1 Tax=Desulfocurvus sp. TaxID=2871698 RepID=UPI0025C46620|nr:cytochrome c3 family protein [Desulfocurvus sp.]MCK9239531.1 cytochrome c family protein [Desulfocurvus sp.]
MHPRHVLAALALAALAAVALVAAPTAWSQDDIVELKAEAFGTHLRPAAVFKHDEHNEKAGLDDCARCHHYYEDGKLVEGQDSVGTPCSDCHALKGAGGQPGLREAYHRQCKDCHVEKAAGPLACGECHTGS